MCENVRRATWWCRSIPIRGIRAPRAETRLLELGFSDRACVFLNGVPIYRGDDTYRSRDYRFLGSIGWYDALYLQARRRRQ